MMNLTASIPYRTHSQDRGNQHSPIPLSYHVQSTYSSNSLEVGEASGTGHTEKRLHSIQHTAQRQPAVGQKGLLFSACPGMKATKFLLPRLMATQIQTHTLLLADPGNLCYQNLAVVASSIQWAYSLFCLVTGLNRRCPVIS